MEPYIGCAFVRPTKKAEEEGVSPHIVVDLTLVLADSQEMAIRKIAKKVDDEFDNDRLEVRAFPFRS